MFIEETENHRNKTGRDTANAREACRVKRKNQVGIADQDAVLLATVLALGNVNAY